MTQPTELTLNQLNPEVSVAEVVRGFVLTPRFANVSFDNYSPDPAEPSQAQAVERLRNYVADLQAEVEQQNSRKSIFQLGLRKKPALNPTRGIYLDGGYGVGKTHLLAAAYRAAPEPKAFLSFQELAYTIGAMGMPASVSAFSTYRLLCVDEFELDDVGNTMLARTFITELIKGPTRIITTSNTLPSELGAGRFAADDFKREIGQIAAAFDTVRIEGRDYRSRAYDSAAMSQGLLEAGTSALQAAYQTCQPRQKAKLYATFDELSAALALHHPIRYARLLAPLEAVFIEGLAPISDQMVALRLVHFIDKLYDLGIRLRLSSFMPLPEIFLAEYRDKGYAKKYRRCLSRLHELLLEGE